MTKLVIIDGTPKSGRFTLAGIIADDLGTRHVYESIPVDGCYRHLRWILEERNPEAETLIVAPFHLTAAAAMQEGRTDLTAEEWSVIDNLVARSGGWLISLVDAPAAIEQRLETNEWERWSADKGSAMARYRLGQRLQHINQALRASSISRKGSYTLKTFMDPTTGMRTGQYENLLKAIREQEPSRW